nr:purine permease 3-like [Ipomoea batatas]
MITQNIIFAAAALGVLLGRINYVYTYGVAKLLVSTSSLIVASQLAFTADAAFVLVKQRFTVNAVVLLTIRAEVLLTMSEPMGTAVDVLVVFPQILELVWPHADLRKREVAGCPVAQQVVSEGHGGRPGDAVVDGGEFPRCGGLRRPGLEDIVDEQVGFDSVKDVAEAWAGHSECLAEGENEVAREIFCGVAARRKKLREIAGVEMDFHRVDFVIEVGDEVAMS